ncbi:hypothetical protein AAG570_014080 [Ranatra chinensis]|uniref:Fatty acyl-CoA reductase n=1 Tax=Ranatra chinensis TaxID=642074 RepID=A0ABD0XS13_9HEMI
MEESPIAEFYAGKSILVTGGTGFLGKVLIEKLLRCCPDLHTIYLLIRPKQGQPIGARLTELLNTKVFDRVKAERWGDHDRVMKKLVAVEGDLSQDGLGLSSADRQLLMTRVSIVFHSAATVKFDEPLSNSVATNLAATKRLVDLCLTMTKLQALVHVSTAYCNCDRSDVSEHVYPPPGDPEKIIKLVQLLDPPLLDQITPKLIEKRPNTYTFTKALAEHLILQQEGRLPIAIVRPSIVTASWKEPFPGWIENLNGPTGLIAGAGKGILRSMWCSRDNIADLIPVDVVINLIVTVAWHTATVRPNNLVVYHCTSGSSRPVRWGDIEAACQATMIRDPFSEVVWYPGGSFKKSRTYNALCVLLFHTAPAFLFDLFAIITSRKPVMVRVQRKLQKALACLEFFTTNEFRFSNDNTLQLLGALRAKDRQTFDFDLAGLDWTAYLQTYIMGTRTYIMKDDPSTLPSARAHLNRSVKCTFPVKMVEK